MHSPASDSGHEPPHHDKDDLPEAFDAHLTEADSRSTTADDSAADPDDASAASMTFLEHLEDLRWTIFKCIIAFVCATVLIAIFLTQFADILRWPYEFAVRNRDLQMSGLINTSILGVFSVIFYLFVGGGFALSLPFMLYFGAQFIAPGLEEKELKIIRPACTGAFVLFLAGCAFSFFILVPAALRASILFNELLGFTPLWTAASYYELLTWMTLGVGVAFQFPLILLILVYIGVLSHDQLVGFRRYSIVLFLCVCAVITPTTDPFTFLILAIPLSILYEAAIIGARTIETKRMR